MERGDEVVRAGISRSALSKSLASMMRLLSVGIWIDPDKMRRIDFIESLWEPTIRQMINLLELVLKLGCYEKMNGIVMPFLRNTDHYKKWEKVWYYHDPLDADEDDILRFWEVDHIEDSHSYQNIVRSEPNVFITKTSHHVPLRSPDVFSESELRYIKENDLVPLFKELLWHYSSRFYLFEKLLKDIAVENELWETVHVSKQKIFDTLWNEG